MPKLAASGEGTNKKRKQETITHTVKSNPSSKSRDKPTREESPVSVITQRPKRQQQGKHTERQPERQRASNQMGRNLPGQHIAASSRDDEDEERQQFLLRGIVNDSNQSGQTKSGSSKRPGAASKQGKRKAQLARQETMDEYENQKKHQKQRPSSCMIMLLNSLKRKVIFIPLIIISCIAAIYCVPYIEIEPRILKTWPHIPFNFQEGPLRSSTPSQFKVEHLFRDEVQGPESVALDSMGNMYMAIEGGFIMYAHLNASSPLKRAYYELQQQQHQQILAPSQSEANPVVSIEEVTNHLVKIAELNGVKQMPHEGRRRAREGQGSGNGGYYETSGGVWRRECQLDEKIYGQKLFSGGLNFQQQQQQSSANEIDRSPEAKKFKPNVMISRCSKPLGIRLSPDESYLYVVDTLSGLYRISLRVAERPYSTQRLVTKLVDFRTNKSRLLPIARYDSKSNQAAVPMPAPIRIEAEGADGDNYIARNLAFLNISLMAVDDLVIDYGAGTRGGDLIYMTDASQTWPALSFVYDMLEGRPSGVILLYDSGSNQLSVLDPRLVSQVRTHELIDVNFASGLQAQHSNNTESNGVRYLGIGAPRLDENDVFDDRPLHFPNGLELTDDRQAILIADTTNRRIIKHWLRGPRRGSSDLWAWTPMYPDNIRRGYDKELETYWVVGCGQDMSNKIDTLAMLNSWPRVRKYILKNIYLFGWVIETFGTYVLRSTSVKDFGYSFKIGHYLCNQMCPGMMIIQYNKNGDIIRSIHSRAFPNDLVYYSQVNELIDPKTREHVLYLSSPYYEYVTKLSLPTDVHPPDFTLNDVR